MIKGVNYFFIILMFAHLGCDKGVSDYEWGNPKNLGSNINSSARDEHATFNEDVL